MDEIDTLIENILVQLRKELPDKYLSHAEEFSRLVDKDLLRASYGVLDQLKRVPDWNPSAKLQALIRAYQIVF